MYSNLAEFRGDIKSHRIGSGGKFDWKGESALYKWRVSAVRRLAQPVPQPGFKGTTGFAQPRPHTVRFIDEEAPTTRDVASPSDAAKSSMSMKRAAPPKEVAQAKTTSGLKKKKITEPPIREGLFFDQQERAWCGMHALNNYMLEPLVQQDDCKRAALQVVRRLSEVGAGDEEALSQHLHPKTGWLSLDVINVLGQANLGIHVESARTAWLELQGQEGCAALVNWNQSHWTVLQRDPSGDGWMHTNSIEGAKKFHGRKRQLSDGEVHDVLADIYRATGDYALHVITPSSTRRFSCYEWSRPRGTARCC